MDLFARVVGLTAVFVALLLPTLAAQEKKDPKKDDKADVKKDAKDDAKKGDPKDKKKTDKTDKKDKADPKPKAPEEEKIVWGNMTKAKLARVEASSKGGFTIQPVDPQKIYNLNVWITQQKQGIAQAPNPQEYFQRMKNFQSALPGQQANIYGKDFEVRPADKMKIRTHFPPTKYDDTGNMVKWTAKDLKELKGNTKLAGYPAELDALRAGQVVEVYFAKVAPSPTGKGKKKTIDDDVDALIKGPEVVLIIVIQEAPMRQ